MNSEEQHPIPEILHTGLRQWPIRKIFAVFVAVLVVFGSGVAVGKGELHPRTVDSNGRPLPTQLDYSSVNNIYNLLKSNFDGTLNQNQLLDGLKSGLVSATGDPYSEYFNPQQAKDFNDELNGSFTGIGAELGTDSQNHIVIISPLSGYPAQKAGLKPKDIISAVNGQSTNGLSVDAVVQKIRGPANTKVTLTIIRNSGNPFNVTLTRANITVASVTYSVNGKIGYLKISQFGSDTTDLVQKAAQQFKAKGVRGIVLDLRGDPGGYLQDAVDVSSMWLDKGKTVVSERKQGKTIDTNEATGDNPFKGLPTVVLIDGGSASASEITAGALHDNGAVTLVGEKSFGKGSVQKVIDLSGGGELKVTIAHWYTPDGKNIDKQGIKPDVAVGITDAQIKAGQDPQKDKAFAVVESKIH